jgi:hypothetical protein
MFSLTVHHHPIAHRGQARRSYDGSEAPPRGRHHDSFRKNFWREIFEWRDFQFRQREAPLRRKLEVRLDADSAARNFDRLPRRNYRKRKTSDAVGRTASGGRYPDEHLLVCLRLVQAVPLPGANPGNEPSPGGNRTAETVERSLRTTRSAHGRSGMPNLSTTCNKRLVDTTRSES